MVSSGVRREDPLLVGFSGGRDSVALVVLLQEAGFRQLTLLHLDHVLRPESGADAEWCRQFAGARGLEIVVERTAVGRGSGASAGVGLEEAGRQARYAFFAREALQRGVWNVALGHHADDQVETFLFRLLRGSGSLGLGAMAPLSEREVGVGTLRLLRPLLRVWRTNLDEWIQARKLQFLEDPTNSELRWTRNRIRHELLPAMERVMERPVKSALWRAAELLRAESDYLRSLECPGGGVSDWLDVRALRALPLALRRLRVLRWLTQQGVNRGGFELVEAVARLAVDRFPARLNLPGGGQARRRAGRIFVENAPGNRAKPV
jgi:tRNA(Ile)-lysidine synthase